MQIGRTLNMSREQRASLLSARSYINAKFDRCGPSRCTLSSLDLLASRGLRAYVHLCSQAALWG